MGNLKPALKKDLQSSLVFNTFVSNKRLIPAFGKSMKQKNKNGYSARLRILDAAGEIFAECGFRRATVRDICGKAGVNLAAVNYHFGGKEKLYLETLRNVMAASFEKYPPEFGASPGDRPEIRLRAYIRSFLLRVLDKGRPSWFGRILAREMIEPTPILKSAMKEVIHPNFLFLVSIVKELLGSAEDEDTIRLCSASIVGQCLYFGNTRSAFVEFNRSTFSPENVEKLIDHITRFSLYALSAVKNRKGS